MAHVVVIGAGPAGLTAAWTLARNGVDVQVLEKEDVPGGRVRSERQGGFIMDRGASFLSTSHREVLALSRELGIEDEVDDVGTELRYKVLKDGQFHFTDYTSRSGPLTFSAVPLMQRLRTPLLMSAVLRARKAGSDFSRLRGLSSLDDASIREWAGAVGPDFVNQYFEPFYGVMWGWTPERTTRAYAALLGSLGGQRILSYRRGMGTLTETLAARVKVRCRTRVSRIFLDGKGVGIDIDGEPSIRADAVVLAVPGSSVLRLWADPPRAEKAFLNQVEYGPIQAVYFTTSKEYAEPLYGYLFPAVSGRATTGCALEHMRSKGRAPAGKGLLYTSPAVARYEELADAPDDQIIELCMKDIEDIFPGLRQSVESARVFRWAEAMPRLPVGSLHALERYRREQQSCRIVLAGDYLACPTIEGAVSAGRDAAASIAKMVN